jgi:hypothetical protein
MKAVLLTLAGLLGLLMILAGVFIEVFNGCEGDCPGDGEGYYLLALPGAILMLGCVGWAVYSVMRKTDRGTG